MIARHKVAQTEMARLRSLLEYRFIRAPFNGVVTKRMIDTGHFVQGMGDNRKNLLFTVASVDTVRVVVEVPEADAALVQKGTPAIVKVQALKMTEFKSEVKRTSDSLEHGSRTLRVEIDLPNSERKLRSGMYVQARIIAEMPVSWVLPANAILKQADQTICFIYNEGNAIRTPIQFGRSDGTFTEVFKKQSSAQPPAWEDFTGKENILAGPISTLKDGEKVSIGE
jgi:RND family efflux transporter MFP subunit